MKFLLSAVFVAAAAAAPASSSPDAAFSVSVDGHRSVDLSRERAKLQRKYGWQGLALNADNAINKAISSPMSIVNTILASPINTPFTSQTKTWSNASTSTVSSQDGEVTTSPDSSQKEFLSPVTVGQQTLEIDFDTGSADFWVFSTELDQQITSVHQAFDPSKSPSWRFDNGSTWNITYGDGTFASGNVGFDTVEIGGSVVHGQSVELAENISSSFVVDSESDGILGLGFMVGNTIQPKPQRTFFENVMPSLTLPVFTVDLTAAHGAGTYDFGTIDNTKYQGDITYVTVDPSVGFWQFHVSEYEIGGQQISMEPIKTIADTGTSLLYLNSDLVQQYYLADNKTIGAVWADDYLSYLYDCNQTLPDLSIHIGDFVAKLESEDLNFAENIVADTRYPNKCFGGLQPSPFGAKIQILGDLFLQRFFAVFDGGATRFGIAEKA